MAQFNSLLVTGNSRFLNPINGDARNGIYYVKGTQTASTGAWTGNIPVPALYDGLTIMYYLPYAGSGNATLNLTLSTGATTGAINCYYSTSRLTTHYGKGCNIVMTYHPAGSISVDGTATTDNRWVANANYADGNDTAYNVRNYYNSFVAGPNKIFPYTIIMQNSDGRWESIVTSSSTATSKARNTHGFRLGQIALMYANATYNENATVGNTNVFNSNTISLCDHRYSFNTANDATSGTTSKKPIYLVGALGNDGLFYLDTTWWTQTLPTTADGKLYIYIGDAYDYYRMSFNIYHPVYCYTNGKIRQYSQDAGTVNGHTVAKDVPSNAEFTDTQSDWNATSGKAQILNKPTIPTVNNGTLTIQKNGTQVATFTANQSGNSTANITVPTVTDTYSSTGTDATSGKAVAAALGTLDGTVSGTPSSAKTLTAFSQTDGKVSATFGNISITKSQVSDFPTLGTAAAKNATTSVTSGSNDLVTSGAVYTAIDNLPEPMVFKGSLGTGGTITSLPVNGTASIGDTYKVITAGTYASQSAKVGDAFICDSKTSSANTWVLIPSGDEPSGTVTSVTIKATSPIAIDSSSAITTSGTRTLSHANSGVTAGTYNSVTVNATGHVTAGTNPTTLAGYGITDALPSSTTYAGSSSVGGAATSANKLNTNAGSDLNPVYFSNGVPVDSLGNTIPYIVGTGTTAGTWTGTLDGLTEYYDGLLILYKSPVAGASTTTLNLNGLGAKTVYINSGTKLTTHYPANQPILLVYSTSQNSGCWEAIDNYWTDSNTIPSGFCTTATDTAAKVASCSNFSLKANSYLHILFRYANTAKSAVTLNVNSTGAKPVYINGTASSASNYSIPAGTYIVFYNGTNYYLRTDNLLPASIDGDAATVGGHTVAKNVPSDALFTDTTYTGTGLISVNASTHVISTTAQANVQSDWNATSGDAFIKNKPTIPTVNNATLTIQKNGSTVKTFTANASSNVTCNITVPTATSDLTNDSSFCAINDNASSSTSTFSSSKITNMVTPWYSYEYLDTSTNCANTTYVIKPPNVDVPTAGVYLCVAHVHFKQNGNGVRELRILQTRDGEEIGLSTGTTGPASNVGDAALCETFIFSANAGDRFSLQLYQSSGGTLAATFRQLQVYRLSSTFMPAS